MSASLTETLLASDPAGFKTATQSAFLAAAARGQISKDALGKWLANDRMYIHSYIQGTGHLLATGKLPVAASANEDSHHFKLLDWLVEALVNVRREERFFIDTANRFGIKVELPTADDGSILEDAKVEGLRRFEELFSACQVNDWPTLPWLEAAVVFWATEKCYLDAWTWAKSQMLQDTHGNAESDQDGGAVRTEFIHNWTSPEFVEFVDKLGRIIDDAVNQQVQLGGSDVRDALIGRAKERWGPVLEAEKAFWPSI